MAHGKPILDPHDRLNLEQRSAPLFWIGLTVGVAGLVLSVVLGLVWAETMRRFYFAYLVSYMFVLSIALGSLFFVLIQHITRAGWSVNVRRPAEVMAASLPVLALLAIPILVSFMVEPHGQLYRWAQPVDHAHHAQVPHEPIVLPSGQTAELHHAPRSEDVILPIDYLTEQKLAWLNVPFFVARLIIYLGVWSWLGWWYWRKSTLQDQTGELELTRSMEWWAPLSLIVYAVTVTLASFDLIMSLDPTWYSTIFGVYYFTGAVIASVAVLTLTLMSLQNLGLLKRSITTEHYHDLGKLLFAFTFFWGYIAFSQYMLIWYGNLPDAISWFRVRGATTAGSILFENGSLVFSGDASAWSIVSILLLFGHFIIPFLGLLSRHVKRNRFWLGFWCVWLLVFHWVDMWWLIMPELGPIGFPLIELVSLLGVGGIYFAWVTRMGALRRLLPVRDPRIIQSLAFRNI